MKRKCPVSEETLIRLYTVDHLTLREIGKQIRLSAQSVWRHLKSQGISASQGERVLRECRYCHQPVSRTRSASKRTRTVFCNSHCYIAFLRGPEDQPIIPCRNGSLIARDLVSKYFNLLPLHVVHHMDQDQTNNQIENLSVFVNQNDHMAYHRGNPNVKPIWSGSTLSLGF